MVMSWQPPKHTSNILATMQNTLTTAQQHGNAFATNQNTRAYAQKHSEYISNGIVI